MHFSSPYARRVAHTIETSVPTGPSYSLNIWITQAFYFTVRKLNGLGLSWAWSNVGGQAFKGSTLYPRLFKYFYIQYRWDFLRVSTLGTVKSLLI